MNIIESIKEEFKKVLAHMAADAPVPDSPVSGDTSTEKNYTPDEIKLSDKVVGAKVEVINSDGSLGVAADGDYNVDGFEFTVNDGVIASIKGQEEPVDENMADVAPAEPNADIEAIKSDIEALKTQVAEIATAISGITAANMSIATKEDLSKFEQEVANLNSTIVKLAKLPVEGSKTNNNPVVQDSKNEKLIEFAKMLNTKR